MEKNENKKESTSVVKNGEVFQNKPKSYFTLFWEKYPNGYKGGCEVINRRAVLR